MLGAPSNLDDWVQIIILVLIFGGSLLGAVAKKLIAFFGSKADQQGQMPQIPTVIGDDPRARRHPLPTARPAPALPPARPAGKAPTMRPVAKPHSLEQPVKPTLADLVHEVFDQQHSDTARVPADTASPPPIRPAARSEAPRIKKRRSTREEKRLASGKKQRSGKVKSAAVAKSELEGVDPEKHLGHLHSKIEQETEQMAAPADSIRHPSKNALRRAIIMSEILRSPLALREDNDSGA